MSASNEWFEYHLTPGGWLQGSMKLDFVGIKEKPVPTDRVLTIEYKEQVSSHFSPLEKTASIIFRIEDEALISELMRKFGKQPAHKASQDYVFD